MTRRTRPDRPPPKNEPGPCANTGTGLGNKAGSPEPNHNIPRTIRLQYDIWRLPHLRARRIAYTPLSLKVHAVREWCAAVVDALGSMFEAFEATAWTPAIALTLHCVPKQFRHLWTHERARDLVEWAFGMAIHQLHPYLPARLIGRGIIPALEGAVCTVEGRP